MKLTIKISTIVKLILADNITCKYTATRIQNKTNMFYFISKIWL